MRFSRRDGFSKTTLNKGEKMAQKLTCKSLHHDSNIFRENNNISFQYYMQLYKSIHKNFKFLQKWDAQMAMIDSWKLNVPCEKQAKNVKHIIKTSIITQYKTKGQL